MEKIQIRSALSSDLSAALRSGSVVRLRVISDSMRPWLRRGDVVVVEAAPIETISRGEVIVFRAGEEFVTHRVIQITPRGMLTKGDALRGFDPLCDISQILGRVFQVERNDKVRYNFHSRLWRIVLPLLGTLHAGIGRAAARFRRMRKSISTKKPS